MFDRFRLLKNEESGQVLVLVALSLTVLCGFVALAIDVGGMVAQKSQLQNAADAAALAAAQDLPTGDYVATADTYAEQNAGEDVITIATRDPLSEGDMNKIKVECTKDYNYTFARGLLKGFTDTTIRASAVAKKKPQWAGEALPFLNMGFDYSTTDPVAWTKIAPGIKGDIYDFRTFKNDSGDTYYELEYKDGLAIKPGFAGGLKGLDGSKLKDGLDDVLTPIGKIVFLFSLRSDLVEDWQCKVNNETDFTSIDKLKNTDVIKPDQLVLIECKLVGYDKNNLHNIQLTYTGHVFDLGNNIEGNDLPDYPTDNLSSSGGSSSLVE